MTEKPELIIGAFYWAMPALDPDRLEDWEYFAQPVRFYGRNDAGALMWQCINQEEPTDWHMRWIGPRILSPMGDEDERLAKGNSAPEY